MKPAEKLRAASKRTRLRKLDIAIQHLRKEMAEPAATSLPIEQIRAMGERLADLSGQYQTITLEGE